MGPGGPPGPEDCDLPSSCLTRTGLGHPAFPPRMPTLLCPPAGTGAGSPATLVPMPRASPAQTGLSFQEQWTHRPCPNPLPRNRCLGTRHSQSICPLCWVGIYNTRHRNRSPLSFIIHSPALFALDLALCLALGRGEQIKKVPHYVCFMQKKTFLKRYSICGRKLINQLTKTLSRHFSAPSFPPNVKSRQYPPHRIVPRDG